jgi:hypothetical protein
MQPVARVVAVGIAAAILIAGIGPVAQRLAIGADDAAAAATVERDVRGAFGVMTRQLSDRGRSVALTASPRERCSPPLPRRCSARTTSR